MKEYPNSPELGTIKSNDRDSNEDIILENYPEFWEELIGPPIITEDGVQIYKQYGFFIVDSNLNVFYSKYNPEINGLIFSSYLAAIKYITNKKIIKRWRQI